MTAMEVVQVRGVVERLTWDERGVGTLRFADPSMLPVYIKELQKPELPKDLKKGDTVTVTGNQGQKHLFLLNMKRGEAASPEETGSASSIQNLRPPAEQPPKTEDFNIAYSAKKIGQLYSVLVDPEGNVVDGLHRLAVNKEWRKEVLPWVRSRKDFLVARIHANLHRRTVPKEERQREFTELANILVNEGAAKGKLAEEISELTGFDEDYVRKLLPRSFKLREKAKAGKAGGETGGRGRVPTSGRQPETLPDQRVDLEEEAKKRALAVDSALPQNYADLYVGPCPACGVKLRWDQERKIFARAAD